MQTNLEKSQTKKYLLFSILTTGFIMLIANFLGKEAAILTGNLLYIPLSGGLVILSIIITTRFRATGDHGKAWVLFTGYAISSFVAEMTWLVYDLVYDVDPFPSIADIFYLAAYPLLFLFSLYYLKPVKNAISKKILFYATLASVAILIPSLYVAHVINSEISSFEFLLALSYPILDAVIFIPALIGVILFFRGEVNFLWSLMCVAIIFYVAADTGFLLTTMNDSYYTGHPIETLFHWVYVLFSFGVYSHIQIFKKHHTSIKFQSLDDLR